MRTRPNFLRRLKFRGEKPAREYRVSASIYIGADCKGSSTALKTAALAELNARFPWVDALNGVERRCEFRWDPNVNSFVSIRGSMFLLSRGQLAAFERYLEKLCEELHKVQTWSMEVFEAGGDVVYVKEIGKNTK